MNAQNVVKVVLENVAVRDATISTRLLPMIRKMEEEYLVPTGNAFTLNVVSMIKQISIIQL